MRLLVSLSVLFLRRSVIQFFQMSSHKTLCESRLYWMVLVIDYVIVTTVKKAHSSRQIPVISEPTEPDTEFMWRLGKF